MLELIWHIAEVVDIDEMNAPIDPSNSDTETNKPRLGRVQLKFIPGHREVNEKDAKQKELLPWARPFMHSFKTSFNPPKVGSKVWAVVIDEFYKNIFYLDNLVFNTDVPLDAMLKADFKDFPSDEAELKLPVAFPQFRFFKLPNDSIFFFDTVTKELGIWHSAGAFIMFKADGSLAVRTNGTVDIKSTGDVKLDTSGKINVSSVGDITIESDGNIPITANAVPLGTLIYGLADVLNQLLQPAAVVSNGPAPMTPCLIPSSPAWIEQLAEIQIDSTKFGS